MLDDELLGSKAGVIESKTVSDRKSGGEGSTCDALCFQILLAMRLRTVTDSQLESVSRLLDNMPSIHDNSNSMHGPILACDRGYGKKSFIEMLGAKHYKVVTIASPIGSDHPIISSTTVSAYVEKVKAAGIKTGLSLDDNSDEEATDELSDVLDRNVDSFLLSLEDYTLHDDPNQ